MTTTVQDIVDRVEVTLKDVGNVRWPVAEIIDAVNDAQGALLEARPDLFQITYTLPLAEGNEQNLPANGYELLDVMYNIDGDGVVGLPVTKIDFNVLTRQRRAWTESGADLEVRHWTQDIQQKTSFFVAPMQPNGTGQKLRIRYAKRPDTVNSVNDQLDTPDEVINAVYYFCVSRALEKDEKFSGSPQAARFSQLFAAFITARAEADRQMEQVKQANEES